MASPCLRGKDIERLVLIVEDLGNGNAEHRTQQTEVGRADVRIQFLAKGTIITDAIDEERRCRLADGATARNIWRNTIPRKKKKASLLNGGAGWSPTD